MKQHFHTPLRAPVDGQVALPDEPGLGLVLDESKVAARRVWPG
jgi:hypothetical protein